MIWVAIVRTRRWVRQRRCPHPDRFWVDVTQGYRECLGCGRGHWETRSKIS